MSNVEKTFRHGKLEMNLDVSDYVTAERWENSMEKLRKETSNAAKLSRESARLKVMVQAVTAVFESLFGEGAAKQAFEDSTSYDVVFMGLTALIAFVNQQGESIAQQWRQASRQYAPRREQAADEL